MEKITKWCIDRLSSSTKVAIAREILEDIQKGTDYSIKNNEAEKIIESVVRSNGNKVVDFILKD